MKYVLLIGFEHWKSRNIIARKLDMKPDTTVTDIERAVKHGLDLDCHVEVYRNPGSCALTGFVRIDIRVTDDDDQVQFCSIRLHCSKCRINHDGSSFPPTLLKVSMHFLLSPGLVLHCLSLDCITYLLDHRRMLPSFN